MSSSQKRHGLQLPAALAQELGLPPREDGGSSRSTFAGARGRGRGGARMGSRGGGLVGRKETRKAARQAKKQHRHDHAHDHGHRTHSQAVRVGPTERRSAAAASEGHPPQSRRLQGHKVVGIGIREAPPKSRVEPREKDVKAHSDMPKEEGKRKNRTSVARGESESEEEALPKKKARTQEDTQEKVSNENAVLVPPRQSRNVKKNVATPLQRLLEKAGDASTSRLDEEALRRRKRTLTKAEQDEEDEIAWLEHKIGKKAKRGEDDGLDELIGGLDHFYPGMYDAQSDAAEQERQSDLVTSSEPRTDSEEDDPDESEQSDARSPPSPPPRSQKINRDTVTPLQRLLEKAGGGADTPPTDGPAGQRHNKRSLTKAEQDEDDEIAWLEYKLGRKGKDGEDDGLADLLGDLDRFYPGMYDSEPSPSFPVPSEKGKSDAGSFYDFGSQTVSEVGNDSNSDDTQEDQLGSEDERDASVDDNDAVDVRKAKDEADSIVRAPPASASAPDTSSGKYIPPALRRLQAAEEAEVSKATVSAVSAYDDPANTHLKRQLKGQLNRLGEGNLDGILTTLEGMFSGNARAVVTQILTRLLIDAVVFAARATDQFIVLNAALISALHRTIGIEFGASFVADLVDQLVSAYGAAQKAHAEAVQKVQQVGHSVVTAAEGLNDGDTPAIDTETMQVLDPLQEENSKKALNLVSLLCELYNLQTVSCLLVYDLIRHFARPDSSASAGLSELSVELLLRIVRLCGAQLRSDDSSSLRDIVDFVQEKAVPTPQSKTTSVGIAIPRPMSTPTLSSRSKFMLERLADLRSGRSQRQGGAGTSDTLIRMKKFIGGLGKKRSLRTHDAIRVTLRDLQDADRKGRWWLVGAAWTGHEGGAGEGVTAARPLTSRQPEEIVETDDEESQKHKALVAYARAHGLGTSVRQGIFITIMTSADFVDAASRLQGLRLNEVQRREIVRVLVRCVQIDAAYNPYFALIGFQLAGPHVGDPARAVRFTMQYALWDFMRATLGQTGVAGKSRAEDQVAEDEEDRLEGNEDVDEKRIANVARSYAWWIAKGALTLNVLKVRLLRRERLGVCCVY